MNATKLAAIVMIVLGALALVYGGFTYTDRHTADLGAVKLSVDEKDRFNVPAWAGAGLLAVGVVLLLMRPKG